MNKEIAEFCKNKEFLFCLDSDGCVIDGMTIKHVKCFGPCFVTVWQLSERKEQILNHWNWLNLYSVNRGINRFQGFLLEMEYALEKGYLQADISVYRNWTQTTKELSAASLKKAYEKEKDMVMEKAIVWSELVNEKVAALPVSKKQPFSGMSGHLQMISRYADIAIISSANREAVMDEWGETGLTDYVDVVMTQECGSKAECIRQVKAAGYQPNHVVMVGDAPGDIKAAKDAEVLYFGILAGHEGESWIELVQKALPQILDETYEKQWMINYEQDFWDNLSR